MERTEVLEKLNDIFRGFFDDESIVLTDETTSDDIEDWDSFETSWDFKKHPLI